MKWSLITLLTYGTTLVAAAPQIERDTTTLIDRSAIVDSLNALEKRKGGGGGGGGKGGSSGGSSSGGSSSGGSSGSRSGSGSSGSSGSGSTGRGSSTSNSGGKTTTGSGPPPAYGSRYIGGATTPYKAGGTSQSRSIAPYAIGGAAVGGFGGYYAAGWIYPVYGYGYYPTLYGWNENGRNRSTNVTCLCQSYQVCGCDPTDDQTILAQMLTNSTNGTGAPVNSSTVRYVDFQNGSAIAYINGSLPNGTTASGGTEDPNASAKTNMISYGGYSIMAITVLASVLMV